VQYAIFSQIYGKTSAYNDEQFVGRWMVVPAVGLIEHGEPQTAVIDAADDHIPVWLGDRRAFGRQIHYVQRGIPHRLLGVPFCC
jgi:hypothetical protein